MDLIHKTVYLISLVLGFVDTAVLPVEKCKLEDSTCMVTQFQKALPVFVAGIPDIGVEVLDVMEMDNVKFDLSGLKFTLTEGKLKGLKNSVIDDVKWDTKEKTLSVEYHMDASLKGHYTAAGQILILPITGDGQMKLKLKNLKIKLVIPYELVKGADGKDHVKSNKYTLDFDVRDSAQYHLTNLFNGNKELSDAMLKFLNENWKQISTEFGRPMIEVAAKKIIKNVMTYFEKTPLSDIANF